MGVAVRQRLVQVLPGSDTAPSSSDQNEVPFAGQSWVCCPQLGPGQAADQQPEQSQPGDRADQGMGLPHRVAGPTVVAR